MSNYKVYLQEIYKLQVELYTKTDQVIATESQNMRSFLTQIKPTNLNQDKKSIFSLMNRDKIIDQHEYSFFIMQKVQWCYFVQCCESERSKVYNWTNF